MIIDFLALTDHISHRKQPAPIHPTIGHKKSECSHF